MGDLAPSIGIIQLAADNWQQADAIKANRQLAYSSNGEKQANSRVKRFDNVTDRLFDKLGLSAQRTERIKCHG